MTTYLRRDEVLAALETRLEEVKSILSERDDGSAYSHQIHGEWTGVNDAITSMSALPTVELPDERECEHPQDRIQMLAREDEIPPEGKCLVWSPICRACGADVPMQGSGQSLKEQP